MVLPANLDYTSNSNRKNLVNGFLGYYEQLGYKEHQPLPITSKQDDSVIFIGAAICSLKQDYIYPLKIPNEGLVIAQNSVRTRNIKNMLDNNFNPKWGSYFTNIDTIYPYERMPEAFEHALGFFDNVVGIDKNDLVLRVNSTDKELFDLVTESKHPTIETDANPEKYYRHSIGIDNIYGENINFAIKHNKSKEYADVGNFIIFKDKESKKPLFLEVGFGDTTILQLKYGLNHILDCYPFPPDKNLDNDYKFKDSIITSLALMREGLEPSSKDEQAKILYKYLRSVYYFANAKKLKVEELSRLIYHSEKMIFGDVIAQPKMINIFSSKENRIKELNNVTLQALQQRKR